MQHIVKELRKLAETTREKLPEDEENSLKLIDQYNYSKYTKRWLDP